MIEVRVPDEIDDYKERIIAGLSVRQLVCGGIALICGVSTFFVFKNISTTLATYATMIVSIPAFCVGFIKIRGYKFETYAKIMLYNFFSKRYRNYAINDEENNLPIENENYRELIQALHKKELEEKLAELSSKKTKFKNRGENFDIRKDKKEFKKKHTGKHKSTRKEYELIEVTKKSIKRKRKAAYKELTAPTRSHRKEKPENKKTA